MKKHTKKSKIGLSLRWSRDFIPNLILVIGAIFVWRGVWALIDKFFFPGNQNLSYILSILLGIILIYLPDGSFRQLGDYSSQK